MENGTVKWECNNWFVREDGLIEIFNQDGNKVILNRSLSIIWKAIDYEADVEVLWSRVQSDVERNIFEECVVNLERHKLISKVNEADIFDSIFG